MTGKAGKRTRIVAAAARADQPAAAEKPDRVQSRDRAVLRRMTVMRARGDAYSAQLPSRPWGNLMRHPMRLHPLALALLAGIPCMPAFAADAGNTLPVVEVTTSKIAEPVDQTPAMITVISGEELRARGVQDLRTALSLVAGVDIAPGGDAGPAGSVPGMWGLREFDAFLLVVDGVPAGGAFNPALTTLDLTDVDRIEVLRGAAPVMYGATSFVGVIHVIHREAGAPGRTVSLWGGNDSSGGAAVSTPLPSIGGYKQSLTVNGEKQGFKDERTEADRGHVLYRGALTTTGGRFHVDFD